MPASAGVSAVCWWAMNGYDRRCRRTHCKLYSPRYETFCLALEFTTELLMMIQRHPDAIRSSCFNFCPGRPYLTPHFTTRGKISLENAQTKSKCFKCSYILHFERIFIKKYTLVSRNCNLYFLLICNHNVKTCLNFRWIASIHPFSEHEAAGANLSSAGWGLGMPEKLGAEPHTHAPLRDYLESPIDLFLGCERNRRAWGKPMHAQGGHTQKGRRWDLNHGLLTVRWERWPLCQHADHSDNCASYF